MLATGVLDSLSQPLTCLQPLNTRDVIDNSIEKECLAGRYADPFVNPPFVNLRCSGLGVVPKRDNGWRIIYDLASLELRSVNDFIDKDNYSLTYCTVDDAASIVHKLGRNCLMGKIDLLNAFRSIPVRKDDWELLGICWKYYVDKCLPFGLRSAPFLFNQVADAIDWILRNNYEVDTLLHYLDDFFTAGPAESATCAKNMQAMLSTCNNLGAPVKPEKVEGP